MVRFIFYDMRNLLFHLGILLTVLKYEEPFVYSFLSILHARRNVRLGIVKIHMEKWCREICVTKALIKTTFKILFQNRPVPCLQILPATGIAPTSDEVVYIMLMQL